LESIAGLAAEPGAVEQATVLFGAAERWRKELIGPMPAWDLARYHADLADARARSQTESFDAGWEIGAALSWEDAIAAARAITNQTRKATQNGR
jgi:hypothetical protein